MGIPAGVVVNRDGIGDSQMDKYLAQNRIPVLLRVPFDKNLAMGLAAGRSLIEILPDYRPQLLDVFQHILALVQEEMQP